MAEKVQVIDIDNRANVTLKELRSELKQLKSQLENLNVDSDEYKETLNEISERQKYLASVTKSSVSDMEGSYNDLTKKLSELRKEWKSTNDEAKRNELGTQMNELNNQLKDLDASVGNFQRNVGNYQSAISDLDTKIQETAESYDDAIDRSNKWVESSDQLQKTSIALVSAFAMIGPALDMMGVEGEEAEKIMSKLQTVMAITAGFKAISEGAKGFTQLSKTIKLSSLALGGFKTALVATGIGAAVVAVGLLAANWKKIATALGLAKKEQEKFNTEYFRMADADFDLAQRIAEASGQMEEASILSRQRYYRRMMEEAQVHRDRIKDLTSQEYKDAVAKEEEYYTLLKKANDDYLVWEAKQKKEKADKASEDLKKFQEERKAAVAEVNALEKHTGLAGINKSYTDQLKKFKEYRTKRLITEEEYKKAELLLQQEYNVQLSELQLQQAEDGLEQLESQQQGRMAMVEKLNREYALKATLAMEDFNTKMTDLSIAGDESGMRQLNEAFIQSQIDALEQLKTELSKYGDEAKDIIFGIEREISGLTNDKKTTEKENDDAEGDERLEKVLELGDILIDTADAVGSAWSNVFTSINDGIAKVGESINKGEKGWTKYGKVASAGLGVASNMLGTLADMQDTQTKEGFEKNKKLQIAAATMAMLAGIVNTWQSVMSKENSWMTIWGQVAAGSAISAMMLATGLAQINQIKSTTFEGGGSGNASASPSITALSAMQPAIETVNQVQGASVENDVKDTRVYVLESDISGTQNKVRTAENEATF